MITPSFSLTATERVLPRLALDFTTASLDPRVTFTRTTGASNPATYIDSAGILTAATNNQPRFDYDPVTLICKGLLIEESRANAATYSEQFDNPIWVKGSSTVTADQIVAPDGTTSMDKLIETATTGFHFIQFQQAINSGTTYTSSIFAKQGERNWLRLAFSSSVFPTTGRSAVFDLANGVVGQVQSGVTATIKPLGNGIYRCSITATATSSATATDAISYMLVTQNTATAESYTGNGTSGLYIWGAQLESGAFPTSYIPTTTTALTRNADVATMTGTNFSDWFNASEGTFLSSFNKVQGAYNYPFSVGDGTNNKFIQVASNAGGLTIIPAITDTTAQTSFSFTPVVGRNTAAIAYKENDIAACCNGNAVQTDILATIPTVNQMAIGKNVYFGIYLNSTVEEIYYFPQRLTNSEVQAITKWNT